MNSQSRIDMPTMGETEFRRWQDLLERRVGVWLPESRKTFLQANLLKQMRDTGIASYEDYFQYLSDSHDVSLEWSQVTDRLTVHETRFFRDLAAMNLVQSYAQRYLNNQAKMNTKKPVDMQVWSVGCSTGEEVYSLAMLLSELDLTKLNEKDRDYYFGVTGIDISYPSLAQAREGIFHQRNLAKVPGHLVKQYFTRLTDGHLQVVESIRQRTCFLQANVRDLENLNQHNFNVIYCQNLLIYFPETKRREIVSKMVDRLADGGLLILGPGELSDFSHAQLVRAQAKQCQAYIKQGSSDRSRVER